MKETGAELRRSLLSYLETRDVYELANIDEMGEELRTKMADGKKIISNLMQYKYSPKTKEEMLNSFAFLKKDKNEN
jgi:F-type H+-transporting ATPase subunit alpha